MLAIEIELLGGRYVATAHDDRARAEWPPHPARFFSALVAALHDRAPEDGLEREALLWLERQRAPGLELHADDLDPKRVGRRTVNAVFVPVNDITLVGDPGAGVRDAETELAKIAAQPEGKDRDKALKKAMKELEAAKKKFDDVLAKQKIAPTKASQTDLEAAVALLPDRRTRQVRTFPSIHPARPSFSFVWPEPPPPSLLEALGQICARVTRLGHSSSLVRCHVVDRPVVPNLMPNDDGELVLRTVAPGQLQRLEEAFAQHEAVEARVLPARPQRYGPPRATGRGKTEPASVFSDRDWIIFERVGGEPLQASRAMDLAGALRAALIQQHGAETLPSALSGHGPDGKPTRDAHVAFVPLPFVGAPHADGRIMGIAIVLPRSLRERAREREQLLKLVASWMKSTRDKDGHVALFAEGLKPVLFDHVDAATKASTMPSTWARPATHFVTATPIVLDRYPGNLRSNQDGTSKKAATEAQRTIATACENIGLPRPTSVVVSFAPMLVGAQHASAFQPRDHHGPPRVRVHAEITFAEKVRGPVLLGAGRHFGLGLCRPTSESGS